MDESDSRLMNAIHTAQVVRSPKQHLATFGVTNLQYHVVTEPSYRDLAPGEEESVIREGRVVSQRPAIVTPTYMLGLEGFSEQARNYMESLAQRLGPQSPGILYHYRNEPGGIQIVSGRVPVVAKRIAEDLDKRGADMSAVIVGTDDLWDVSVLKFIYEHTAKSVASNVSEMQARGLLDPVPGLNVPRGVIQRIEELFRQVEEGLDPKVLHKELVRWNVFDYYENRFFSLFRTK